MLSSLLFFLTMQHGLAVPISPPLFYIGHDVGSRQFPGCHIQFKRRPLPPPTLVTPKKSARDLEEIEKATSHGRVTVLHWAVWDLSRNTLKASYDRADDKTPPISWASDARYEKDDMKSAETRSRLATEIFRTLGERLVDWEPYDAKRYGKVPVFIEPQMDQFKSGKAVKMHELAKAIITCVATMDKMQRLGAPKRTIELRSKKHGLAKGNKGRGKKKGKKEEEKEKEVAPTLILLDQDEEEDEEEDQIVLESEQLRKLNKRARPVDDDDTAPPPAKKRRVTRKSKTAADEEDLDLELHGLTYDELKAISVALCKQRLEQDGDITALRFFEKIERAYASDKQREVVPYDLADAFNIALARAEEEARVAEQVAGMR